MGELSEWVSMDPAVVKIWEKALMSDIYAKDPLIACTKGKDPLISMPMQDKSTQAYDEVDEW